MVPANPHNLIIQKTTEDEEIHFFSVEAVISFFFQYITSPLRRRGGRDAMNLLTHKILKSIMLRRTKKGRAADLALPHRTVCF